MPATRFEGPARFERAARFEGPARFEGAARFEGPARFERAGIAALTVRAVLAAMVMLVTAVAAGYTLSHGPVWLGVGLTVLALASLGDLLRTVNRKLRGEPG